VVIFIAIYPVELQPLRDFESEADFVPPQRGNYLKSTRQQFFSKCDLSLFKIVFDHRLNLNGHHELQNFDL